MTTTLVLTEAIARQLREMTQLDVETGAVLLASVVDSESSDRRLLATRLIPVPDDAYSRREALRLDVTSGGYVPALGEAAEAGTVPVWLHTHRGEDALPRASDPDHLVDAQLSDLFRLRSGAAFYGSLIVASRDVTLRFTGHLDDGRAQFPIERLVVVGERLLLTWSDDTPEQPLPPLFDRSIRAFGGHLQRVLGDLRIAIVGCGGTGSAVTEQLARLGVRRLLLVDPDTLSVSNLTRVYGSRASDVGRPKVDVLADHLSRIAPDATIERVTSMVTVKATAQRLQQADVVFACTDDNAGRLVLSRHATYLLALVIDCGVLLTSDARGRLDGIYGRVTVLHPNAPCLLCRGRIDVARARSEQLTPEERARRVGEGYAPALGRTEPAVVSFTTLVAATAVNELLERLAAYGREPVPNEVILRMHEREVSTNIQAPRERCYCHPDSGVIGLGASDPYLGMVWPA